MKKFGQKTFQFILLGSFNMQFLFTMEITENERCPAGLAKSIKDFTKM